MVSRVRFPVGQEFAPAQLASSAALTGMASETPELYPERVIIFIGEQVSPARMEVLIREAGLITIVCETFGELIEEVDSGAGVAIIYDAALQTADRCRMRNLRDKHAWIDLQIVMLTADDTDERTVQDQLYEGLPGQITLSSYPVRSRSFLSVVRSAVWARRIQHDHRAICVDRANKQRLLQAALSVGQLGTWVLPLPDMEIETSAAARVMLGMAPDFPVHLDDIVGAIHPADLHKWRTAARQIRRMGCDLTTEVRVIWPDGSEHCVEFDVRVCRDGDGKITSLAGVCLDVTGRKSSMFAHAPMRGSSVDHVALAATVELLVEKQTARLMKEVAAREKVQEELRQVQKMETIGQLTGGVAHDFNNLLTAVMGNLELLRRRVPEEPRLHRLIDGAIVGVQRGATLTQRLLAFSRQQDLRTEPVNLGELVLGMREVLTRLLGPGITLKTNIPDGLPPARIDASQLEIAILNLAINARDAMLDGGAMDIALALYVAGGDKDLVPGEYLKVTVSDTGTGMTPGVLAKAIEPFFSTKPLGKGNGLGLSMVHGLAVQLGGALELSSTLHRGTTAVLLVPATDVAPEVSQPQAVHHNAPKNATVLFVDDDPLILLSTIEMLEDLGHKVISANSATQALKIIESDQQLDILMTDYAMPGMTGIELARATREKRPSLPILLATGYIDLPGGVQMDLPRLPKPYHMHELRSRLEQMLA